MSHNPNVRTIYDMSREPSGFPNRTDATVSFDNGTRTLTISPVSGRFEYYVQGVKYTHLTAKIKQIPDEEGIWHFYFDGAELQATKTFVQTIITGSAYVAVVYWNAADNEAIYFGEERHGLTMDGATHVYLHNLNGAVYISGLALGDFSVDGSGNNDAHARFSVADGIIYDEDIIHTITNGSPQALSTIAQLPVFYRLGTAGDWRRKVADTFPLIYPGSVASYGLTNTRPAYNDFNGSTWSLQQVASGNYVLVHVLATNDKVTPVIAILGINQYGNVNAARTGAVNELASLSGLPFAELVAVGTVIFETVNGYTNTVKARVVSTDTGASYVDFRNVAALPIGQINDHGNLSGLYDTDHPASAIFANTANFNGVLSAADTNVQLALDTLDNNAANRQLSNLQSTSVNTSLMPGADNAYTLGSESNRWADGYFGPGSLHVISKVGDIGGTYGPAPQQLARDWTVQVDQFTGGLAFQEGLSTPSLQIVKEGSPQPNLWGGDAGIVLDNQWKISVGASGGDRRLYLMGAANPNPPVDRLSISENGSSITLNGLSYNLPSFISSTSGYSSLLNDGYGNLSWTRPTASVVSANGFAGTVALGNFGPAITLRTTISGLLKGNGTAMSAAVSGSDYAPATSGTSLLSGNGSGGFSNVTIGSGLSFTAGTLSATNSGTVTGVTASSPLASSGGATPNISLTGTVPVANGGTGTSTAFTAGSVVFAGASGVYTQDNANLFFDDTNNRLGIGTAAPSTALDLASGQLAIPDGTAAAPAIAFRDDLNCGFFSPANDIVGISVSGAEVARFQQTGANLEPTLLLGTSTASANFTVDATTSVAGAAFIAHGAAGTAFQEAYRGGQYAGLRTRGTKASPTQIGADDGMLSLFGAGWTSTATINYGALITMKAEQAFTTTASGGRIEFHTTLNGTDGSTRLGDLGTERLRISNTGAMLFRNGTDSATGYQFQRALTATGTATGTQSSTTLQDTTKTWTTDQYAGGVVRLTGGTGSGQERRVVSNTTNTLTVTPAWTTTPVAASTTYSVSGSTFVNLDTTNGRVGIGTGVASLTVPLQVKGSGEILELETTSATGNNWLRFQNGSGSLGYVGYGSAANNNLTISNEAASSAITFLTASTERARIQSDGTLTTNYARRNTATLEIASVTGTATGTQSSTTLQDTSKTWTVNQYAGGVALLTGGTGSGQSRQIVSNTSNTITVSPAWTTTPVSGSTTYAVAPATTLGADHNLVIARTAGSRIVTLPQVTSSNVGQEYVFRKYSAAQLTVSPNAADSFDYGTLGTSFQLTLTTRSYFFKIRSTIVSDGTNTAGVWVLVYFNEYVGDPVASGVGGTYFIIPTPPS